MSTSANSSIAVIGGGNMGAALAGGLLSSKAIDASQLSIVEVVESRRAQLNEMFPGVSVVDTIPACGAAVIAVKPYDVPAAVGAAAAAGARRILSIAAGVLGIARMTATP